MCLRNYVQMPHEKVMAKLIIHMYIKLLCFEECKYTRCCIVFVSSSIMALPPSLQEHAREDSEKRLLQAEADLSQARGLGEGREREVASLRSQLTATQTQLEELQGHSNALSQQSQQLREDLNTMTQVSGVPARGELDRT